MDEGRRGTAYGVGAYALWGLFPLFWPLLEPASALEVLSHRVLWSLVVVVVLLQATRSWRALADAARAEGGRLSLAAALLALNWGTYIYGVNSGQVVETSLGYFINPLVSVALGVVVLGERLRPIQQAAVALAALGVVVLTVLAGEVPTIALVLALSFGTYGLLKKQAGVGAVPSLGVETAALAPVALVYLAVSGGTFTGHGPDHALLLVSTGLITAVPLLLFGAAANRVPLATLGLLQYLAPTLQLLIGVLIQGEGFGAAEACGFGLVWLALAVFTGDLLRHHRRPVSTVAPC